eukprot:11641395-Karenia_brevis.AAC.1
MQQRGPCMNACALCQPSARCGVCWAKPAWRGGLRTHALPRHCLHDIAIRAPTHLRKYHQHPAAEGESLVSEHSKWVGLSTRCCCIPFRLPPPTPRRTEFDASLSSG